MIYHTGSCCFEKLTDGLSISRLSDKVIQSLESFGLDKFEAIAVRGFSGVIIASVVAAMLNKKMCIIRKEGSHGREFEGYFGDYDYIIIDDFIDSGRTIEKIINKMKPQHDGKCVGIFLYDQSKKSLREKKRWTPEIDEIIQGIPVFTLK